GNIFNHFNHTTNLLTVRVIPMPIFKLARVDGKRLSCFRLRNDAVLNKFALKHDLAASPLHAAFHFWMGTALFLA
ncbi:hypothetical protein SC81_23100, partial [Vibrio vulnificus]